MCVEIHQSVAKKCKDYLAELARHNYVTPKSYLELLGLFTSLIEKKKHELKGAKDRMKSGLDKVGSFTSWNLSLTLHNMILEQSHTHTHCCPPFPKGNSDISLLPFRKCIRGLWSYINWVRKILASPPQYLWTSSNHLWQISTMAPDMISTKTNIWKPTKLVASSSIRA